MVILWKYQALADIDHIFDHICADNPVAAGEVINHIYSAVRSLADPELHHIGRPGRWPGTRELVLSVSYIVPYRVTEKAIEILAVIHMAREWPETPESN